ncbi:MAG TPA: DNA-directed RNA polymerase subunit beta [Elusimicrobiales bacterium]|nr:DNA-directed RNA polymerase subunit beta [Elusimicrobiales bacterium]HPO96200.1 DNA-directed RNA polymerase subunit beta [Elusimicrobiales bacterium]
MKIFNEQYNFSKIGRVIEIPDLLEMQKKSFKDFLQIDVDPKNREIKGIQAAFVDVFPIESANGQVVLDFVKYDLGKPSYLSPEEAILRDGTYAAPLKATFNLITKNKNGEVKKALEQEVTLCEIPIMTDNGSFVFNGAERVIVSQLHRSPGIIFEEDEEKKQSTMGRPLYYGRIIPYRGAWIEFEFDQENVLWARLDRKKKVLATVLLRASGIETNADMVDLFYDTEEVSVSEKEKLNGKYLASDVVDENTGEVLFNLDDKFGKSLTVKDIELFESKGIKKVKIIKGNPEKDNPTIFYTLLKNQPKTSYEAKNEIYKKMRAQEYEPPKEYIENFLNEIFYKSIRRYDFSVVGRYKALRKLGPLYQKLSDKNDKYKIPDEKNRHLVVEDLIVTIQYLLKLNNEEEKQEFIIDGKWNSKIAKLIEKNTRDYNPETKTLTYKYEIDDIDHLGNRRVRSVGELLENQIRLGLVQMSRYIKDKMAKAEGAMQPKTIINSAPLVAIIRKFFGTSQLSQFMDQINPLAEMTHKRRLSALGPGGLNRKRAGFEVRDVHYTHYGRVCPIETPEGANIGLIVSLSTYAKVNDYGLIETPYRVVKKKEITDKIIYMDANAEDGIFVGQANTPIEKDKIAVDQVYGRLGDGYLYVSSDKVEYMDISPLQVFSVSASLIPFLENDDANRALMGSNMQRQAVPLLETESPLVATGIEPYVAKDSMACIVARRSGKVIYVSSNIIAVKPDDSNDPDIYHLTKFRRTNQDTCINQKPIVVSGQHVKKGQIIADGHSTCEGQLALGKNILVAFMSWEGYNFEDAILVSERLIEDDVLTSIFIQEYEIEARDTKLGPEEITRDIPNVSSEMLSHLDEEGVVVPSTMVKPGDILVGKVSPRGEQAMMPEERLLKVIFGKKADEVQDTSLRVPPGVYGKVIGTRVFVRREKLTKEEEKNRIDQLKSEMEKHMEVLREFRKESLKNGEKNQEIENFYKLMEKKIKDKYTREIELVKKTGDLSVTVNKVVKVYIALKRRLQVGDKLSGRHGNKGVVSKIMKKEDMPFMPDGTPIDVVLSPLGVPSRMNIGQILEVMLGWAAYNLKTQMICPVFDGPKEKDVVEQIRRAKEHLKSNGVPEAYLPDDYCRITLYDGRTGEPFSEKVTIGYMYILKLIHLVEDKVHARSTGPYSLITRQPLGGKTLFGGQRFGEMEVWALEGYGASYTLQEMLTVKSDDFTGRNKIYESIIKGEFPSNPGVPESFKVLTKELEGLGIDVQLIKNPEREEVVKPKERKTSKKAKAK